MAFITNKQDGLSHSQIILKHLQKILELSTIEFRSGWTERVYEGNLSREVYHPSTIAGYTQAIDSLRDVLIPFFDEIMKKANEEIVDKLSDIKEETKKRAQEKIFNKYKKSFEVAEELHKKNPIEYEAPSEAEWEKKYLQERKTEIDNLTAKDLDKVRINLYQKLFQELNLLLKRKDYLKGVTISEEMDEDGEVEVEE